MSCALIVRPHVVFPANRGPTRNQTIQCKCKWNCYQQTTTLYRMKYILRFGFSIRMGPPIAPLRQQSTDRLRLELERGSCGAIYYSLMAPNCTPNRVYWHISGLLLYKSVFPDIGTTVINIRPSYFCNRKILTRKTMYLYVNGTQDPIQLAQRIRYYQPAKC